MTGEWLAWCQACPVPEIANVFQRSGIPFFQVTGMLRDDPHALARNRRMDSGGPCSTQRWSTTGSGLMGHYYGGMLDIYSDLTQQCACLAATWRCLRSTSCPLFVKV